MGEEKINLPVELSSEGRVAFGGLSKATIDTLRLYKSDPSSVNPVGALTLIGMKAAFPEKFSNEQLRNNPNLKFFNCLVWLGVELNDTVDVSPKAREIGEQKLANHIFDWWKEAIRTARAEADVIPEESVQRRQLVENYQREILYCEKNAKESLEEEASLQRAVRYREMINAISLVHNAAALLGHEDLSSRLETIRKQDLSWEALEDKYEWVIDSKPKNETERRLCGLFNLVMGVQVIDDWFDVQDDQKLGIQTIATQALADEGPGQARTKIQELTNTYFKKAETFGVTKRAGKGIGSVFTNLKRLMRRFPSRGGRRERMLNGGEIIYRKADASLLFDDSRN